MKYWVQLKDVFGNWVDSIGCGDLTHALAHMKYYVDVKGEPARIIKRTDKVVVEGKPNGN